MAYLSTAVTYFYNVEINASVAGAGGSWNPVVVNYPMPFKGSLHVLANVVFFIGPAGLVVSGLQTQIGATTGPITYTRYSANTDDIWTQSASVQVDSLASGTVAVSINVSNSGSATLAVARITLNVTACRIL